MKNTTLVTALLLFIFNAVAQDNHPIIGTWQLKSVVEDGETHTGMQAVWIFDKGGELKAARSLSDGIIPVGKWKCDKKNKTLIMESTFDKDFNGKAKVLTLKGNKLSYKKEGAVLNFEKAEMKKPDNTPLPKLAFTEDDFYKGDEYAYHDSDKLPWSLEQIFTSMKSIREMVYDVDHFQPGRGKTDSWVNSFKVTFIDNGELSIREYSNFQKDYVDMTENGYPLNDENKLEKEFYPKSKPDLFRVVGVEDCKTSLGTFKCTVVEGIDNYDRKVKYWMINEKPGVYAKMIIAREMGNPMDYINVYTLKEIK